MTILLTNHADTLNLEVSSPDDLQWEALVDVLRGKVKIQNHCYEAVDLDGIVRLSNEFNFSIAGFHHAHEAFLVPDLLKKTYGHPPIVAMFATNARYKREAYRGSEFAPKVLAENGIGVVMKSDHPVLNSRYLPHEAQQAHYFGLPASVALASITTTPAKAAGLDHRVGRVKTGYDADLVIWDAHPLALGATPIQVFIDGIPQLAFKSSVRPDTHKEQKAPKTPNFDEEARTAVKADGLPSLEPKKTKGRVVFGNVESLYLRTGGKVVEAFRAETEGRRSVVVQDGKIHCVSGVALESLRKFGTCSSEDLRARPDVTRVDLDGGSMAPLDVRYLSPSPHISASKVHWRWKRRLERLGQDLLFHLQLRLVLPGLQMHWFGTYHSGVTTSITPPSLALCHRSSSSLGLTHELQKGALLSEDTASVHDDQYARCDDESISTQIRNLRKALGGLRGERHNWRGSGSRVQEKLLRHDLRYHSLVTQGRDAHHIYFVLLARNPGRHIKVENAEITGDIDSTQGSSRYTPTKAQRQMAEKLPITFVGAAEAHLLASEYRWCRNRCHRGSRQAFPGVGNSSEPSLDLLFLRRQRWETLIQHNVTRSDFCLTLRMNLCAMQEEPLRWDAGWETFNPSSSEGIPAVFTVPASRVRQTRVENRDLRRERDPGATKAIDSAIRAASAASGVHPEATALCNASTLLLSRRADRFSREAFRSRAVVGELDPESESRWWRGAIDEQEIEKISSFGFPD
ncbi:hypothetical protein AAF712_012702 [Marasmius tenuissimus]|uniref:Amidohydrolase-related domain-containing protein n=1 Tax=Marasmius tenuissimus TaxID=585030 RepID=A0ABR2ZFS3_9AGAR